MFELLSPDILSEQHLNHQEAPVPADARLRPQHEWMLLEPGRQPFIVLSEAHAGSYPVHGPYHREIAVRREVTDQEPRELYYVAMRRTPDGTEEVDSRECDFRDHIIALREVVPPVLSIPGADASDVAGYPSSGGPIYTVVNFNVRQPGGEGATVELTAGRGPIATRVSNLFHATRTCWPSGQETTQVKP